MNRIRTDRLPTRSAAVAAALAAALSMTAGQAQAAPARASASRLLTGPPPGTITTIAGGVGGPGLATNVVVDTPVGVTYAAGQLYVASYHAVRDVNTQTGGLTTAVGTSAFVPLKLGALARETTVQTSAGVAVDHAGNLVVSETNDQRILVVAASTGTFYGRAMTARHVYGLAGTGRQGITRDGIPATQSRLDYPRNVQVDAAGNVIFADRLSARIRVVAASTGTFYGQTMTAGDIYTVAGDGNSGFSGDGGPATSASLWQPYGVALDGSGNLVIADTDNSRIRVVAASTGTFYGQPMTAGDIYTVAGDGTAGFSGDGGLATAAEVRYPGGVAVDGSANLVIADSSNNRIRMVAASTGTFYGQSMTAGDIYTVAGSGTAGFSGDGGAAASAGLNGPGDVTLDGSGNLVIADSGNNRVRVVAASTGTFYQRAMTAGDIYTVAGNGSATFSGVTGLASRAVLYSTDGLAAGLSRNLVISSDINNRVLVDAGATGTFYGQAMTAGHIYIVAGNGQSGYSRDGGPAVKARFTSPSGAVVNGSGNVAAAAPYNHRVRMVAASTGTFYGQAMTAGDIYTIAGDGTLGYSGDGGPATAAALASPNGMAVDGNGNLLIGDSDTNVIRVVAASTGTFYGQPMTAGDIYTIAGDGALGPGYSGDGGPAASAQLNFPNGVSVDAAGNVVIADTVQQPDPGGGGQHRHLLRPADDRR